MPALGALLLVTPFLVKSEAPTEASIVLRMAAKLSQRYEVPPAPGIRELGEALVSKLELELGPGLELRPDALRYFSRLDGGGLRGMLELRLRWKLDGGDAMLRVTL